MFSRISKYFSFSDSEDSLPENAEENNLKKIERQIESALKVSQESLIEAQEQEEYLSKKYEDLQDGISKTVLEAERLLKNGNDLAANNVFSKKNVFETQAENYLALIKEVHDTVLKLTAQVAKLQVKLDEVFSRQKLLRLKLTNAQNQSDVAEQLFDLQSSGEFEEYENLIKDADAKTEALAYLSGETLESEFDESPKEDLSSHLEQKRIEKQALLDEAMFKKVERILGANKVSPKNPNEARQKDKLKKLTQSSDLSSTKKDKIESFFAKEIDSEPKNTLEMFDKPPTIEDKQNIIDNFFKD